MTRRESIVNEVVVSYSRHLPWRQRQLRAERLMEYRGNQFARRTRQDEQISDDSFKKPRKKKS